VAQTERYLVLISTIRSIPLLSGLQREETKEASTAEETTRSWYPWVCYFSLNRMSALLDSAVETSSKIIFGVDGP